MSDDDWLDLFDTLYGAADRVEHAIVKQLRRGPSADVGAPTELLEIFDTAVRQKRDLLVRLAGLRESAAPEGIPASHRFR